MADYSFDEGCLVYACKGQRIFLTPLCSDHMLDAWRYVEANPHMKPSVYPAVRRSTLLPKSSDGRTTVVRDSYYAVVYYLRVPSGRIKIGTTRGLRGRMKTLGAAIPGGFLAAEWGSRNVERARHDQFAQQRRYDGHRSSEEFDECPALMDLISDLRAANGDFETVEAEQMRRYNEAHDSPETRRA